MSPSTPLLDRSAVRAADARAIRDLGVPGLLLMENAGRGLADVTQATAEACGAERVLVVAARGNNGGDGLVAARHLRLRGVPVEVWLTSPTAKFAPTSDPGFHLGILQRLDVPIHEVADAATLRARTARTGAGWLIVDAVFGTGLEGPVRGHAVEVLAWMAGAGYPVVAADLPSGLDADTGEELGTVPRCVATATFLARKPGLDRGAGPACAGRVVLCDIGVPFDAVTGPAKA